MITLPCILIAISSKSATCTIQKSNSMQVVAIPVSAGILPAFGGRDARAPRVLSSFGVVDKAMTVTCFGASISGASLIGQQVMVSQTVEAIRQAFLQ